MRTAQQICDDINGITGIKAIGSIVSERDKCLETLKLIAELPEHGMHCAKKLAAQCYTMVSQGLTLEDLREDEQG